MSLVLFVPSLGGVDDFPGYDSPLQMTTAGRHRTQRYRFNSISLHISRPHTYAKDAYVYMCLCTLHVCVLIKYVSRQTSLINWLIQFFRSSCSERISLDYSNLYFLPLYILDVCCDDRWVALVLLTVGVSMANLSNQSKPKVRLSFRGQHQ